MSTHFGFSMEVENNLMKYTIPGLNAVKDLLIGKRLV